MKPIDKTTATLKELEEWKFLITYAVEGLEHRLEKTIYLPDRLIVEEQISALKDELYDTDNAIREVLPGELKKAKNI